MTFPVLLVGAFGQELLAISWTIPDGTTNYDEAAWRADAIAAGWDEQSPAAFTATVEASSVIGATSTAVPAFETGATALPATSVFKIVNKGLILGRGGNGVAGANASGAGTDADGNPGLTGGPAIRAQIPIVIDNADGIIGGGGGSGGSGASFRTGEPGNPSAAETGGGGGSGGGQGFENSSGGAGGSAENPGTAGTGGNSSSRGSGGVRGQPPSGGGGAGGRGGFLGAAGENGGDSPPPTIGGGGRFGGIGGPGGAAVIGIENVTWNPQGDVRGDLLSL